MNRTAVHERTTKETSVRATVNLDGDGTKSRIETPVGFLSHMIDVIARHGRVDIEVIATGDTFIDYHHTVEDVGLVLGEAFGKALGDKAGIRRFGYAYVPLDEALARVVVDFSGRPYLVFEVPIDREMLLIHKDFRLRSWRSSSSRSPINARATFTSTSFAGGTDIMRPRRFSRPLRLRCATRNRSSAAACRAPRE